MTYKLYLDDIRNPKNDIGTWVIARDFAQAVDIVCKFGPPDFCSFDHDLGTDSQTGYDFAKWLIERDMDYNDLSENFDFNVHSANPVGKENIEKLLKNYLDFKHKKLATQNKPP